MEKSWPSKTHRQIDSNDDNSLISNKRMRTEETDENIEPESENSNDNIGTHKLINLKSGTRRGSKLSPVASGAFSEMGLGLLDSDESNPSTVASDAHSVPKSILSELSSEPMSNLMPTSNFSCIESDSNTDGENVADTNSPTSEIISDESQASAEKTLVAGHPFSIHQDYTPANLIPISRTNFAGIAHSSATTSELPQSGRAIRNTSLKKHKGRSPLAIVSNNANVNVCRGNCTNLGSDADGAKASVQGGNDEDSFFMYRRHDPRAYTGEDNFTRLSDEVILSIFKWLPKKALMRCSLVNHRFNRVSQDESLWTRLDLAMKTIQPYAFGRILLRGVVILRMAQCKIQGPFFKSGEVSREFLTRLQYLDLSMATINTDGLVELFARCKQLKKLSVEHLELNDAVCKELANNKQMEVLNLAMCRGITSYGVRKMVRSMKRLQALNISWTSLDENAIAEFTNHVNENLLRLNISGCRRTIKDEDLVKIVRRCPNLRELDLSDCTKLTSKTIDIVSHLPLLEYLSLSRCYEINAATYLQISQLKSLAFLDVFGVLSEPALKMLQETFPDVGINKFHHSAIARPTVGSRRTSIWGLRTRD